jgi:hypothetical protein
MRVHLSNDGLLPYLLAYLRDNGCTAELVDDDSAISATMPNLTAVDELRMIRGLTSLWRCAYPSVEADFSDHMFELGTDLRPVQYRPSEDAPAARAAGPRAVSA